MSSVASTSSTAAVRPPNKRVRYLTEDSSYSSFSATGTIRREAEEQAARELAAERQASRQRVLSVWEGLEERYSRALDDDDIIDLESLTLVQDTGTLKEIANVPFGSLAAQDDVPSENDEDDDELGDWDDERYSAQHAWNRLKTAGGRPPRTEEDERDLKEFLRAENARKREEILSCEEDDRSHTDRDQGENEENMEGEYVIESEGEEEEEDESVSSFRPTPSQGRETHSASGTESEESDDELAGPDPFKSNKIGSRLARGSKLLPEEATNSDHSTSSSEDEIAASDVEKERLYQERLRTEEPLGRGRFSSVRPGNSPKTSTVTRTIGNPQLSTPPRSKSFSTPSDIFYQNPSPRQKTPAIQSHAPRTVQKPMVARNTARRSSIMPPSKKQNVAPPLPEVALGKRKRRSSPLPTSSSRFFTPGHNVSHGDSNLEKLHPHHERRISHARAYSSSGFTEPPVSFDEYDQGEYESPDEVDTLSRQSLSPIPYRTRPPEQSYRQVPPHRREESLAPSDLSQLVFHLRKVNEWVQTHHVDDLPFAEGLPLPTLPPERSPSKRPAWPSSIPDSTSEDTRWSPQVTPQNRNRIMSARGNGSSARSSRTYSSLMGPPPTPARLFESGSANSSAQSTPNRFSPMKSSPSKASTISSSRVSRPSQLASSTRAASSQPPSRQTYRPALEDEDTDDRYNSSMQLIPGTRTTSSTKRPRHMISPTRARSPRPTSASGKSRLASSTASRRY